MSHTEPTPPSGVPGPEEQPTVAMGSVPDVPAPSWAPAQPTVAMWPTGQADAARTDPPTQAYAAPSAPQGVPPTQVLGSTGYAPAGPGQMASAPAPRRATVPPPAQPTARSLGAVPGQQASAPVPPAQQPSFGSSGTPAGTPRRDAAPASRGGGGAPPQKDKLGGGWIAFIIADVLLVATAVVMAIMTFGPSSGAGGEPSASTSVAASAQETPAGPDTTVQKSFSSPSKNITCDMAESGVTCVIRQANVTADQRCEGSVGYQVVLAGGDVTTTCLTADDRSLVPDPATMSDLPYDSTAEVGSYTCTSTQADISCTDGTTSVSLSKAGIRQF